MLHFNNVAENAQICRSRALVKLSLHTPVADGRRRLLLILGQPVNF